MSASSKYLLDANVLIEANPELFTWREKINETIA